MSAHLLHIASRVVGRPLLLMPQKLDVIAQVLAGRVGLEVDKPEFGLDIDGRPEPLASRFVGKSNDPDPRKKPKYMITDGGVGIITITGSLVNRGAWIGASSGLTSYEGIAAQIRAALEDPRVSSLLLDINSPGGEATGAFELAEIVQLAHQAKPVTAFVNGLAASAGYMIASGAGRIISIPSGISGSIGVVMMHADYSRMLDRAGVTPTLIFSGDHKVDASPYQPLDPDTKAELQAEVDKMREAFVQVVAKGRGRRMSAKAARDTEARIYDGADAKAIGLVDDVAHFDALYEDMNRGAAKGRSPARRNAAMEKEFTQADLDKARTDAKAEGFAAGKAEGHAAGLEEGKKAGAQEGATAERARVKGIFEHAEAKGRESLAAHYAFNTADTVEAAAAALKASAKGSSLDDRARKTENGFHTADANRTAPKIDAADIYKRMNAPAV